MKSIKTKLALFVSCLCIVLIGLVWLLTVVLFEPNYRSMIRTELNTKIAAVAAVLEGDQAEGADILSLISLVKPLMQSGICIEVSATEECIEAHGYTSPTLGTAVPAYRAFFVLEIGHSYSSGLWIFACHMYNVTKDFVYSGTTASGKK